ASHRVAIVVPFRPLPLLESCHDEPPFLDSAGFGRGDRAARDCVTRCADAGLICDAHAAVADREHHEHRVCVREQHLERRARGRGGGVAGRLPSFQGLTTNPHPSPDGKWIAFSGEYSGNVDVYVVPAEGGEPKRLTWHPGADTVQGWTPDGKSIMFASTRASW